MQRTPHTPTDPNPAPRGRLALLATLAGGVLSSAARALVDWLLNR